MPIEAAMKFIGRVDGLDCYWAEEGRFDKPGLWFWNGHKNVHVPLFAGEALDLLVKLSRRQAIVQSQAGLVDRLLKNNGYGTREA